jgi:hypothetical protein
VTLPVGVFAAEAKALTIAEQRMPDAATVPVVIGKPVACAWESGQRQHRAVIIVPSKDGPNHAPAWDGQPGSGFAGAASIEQARERALLNARVSLSRAGSPATGAVTATVTGSAILEEVITVAAEAADQPEYVPAVGGDRLGVRMQAAGQAGAPWVRCWIKVGGTVVRDPAAQE